MMSPHIAWQLRPQFAARVACAAQFFGAVCDNAPKPMKVARRRLGFLGSMRGTTMMERSLLVCW